MKKMIIASLAAVLATTITMGYEIQHPNLKDAYAAAADAIRHIEEAQGANKDKFGGHAEKAIEHLKQAQQELIEGDKWADAHRTK
jgi:hypothetical protein